MTTDVLRAIAATARREQLLLARRSGYAGGLSELPDKLRAIEAAANVFAENRVPYALIGGLAVGIRSGVPRATLDVDFAIATSADRKALIARFVDREFSLTGEFAHSINLKHESGEPVQLAFDANFDPMIGRAEALRFGNLTLRVVTKEDLADIALLEGDVPNPDEGW
jgi:hypothetical protein